MFCYEFSENSGLVAKFLLDAQCIECRPCHYRQRSQLCVRQGIWKTFSPELLPIKDTKVENIFCSSFVFGQPDMQLIVALRCGFIRRPLLTQNCLLAAVFRPRHSEIKWRQ
jgi:hypothetical protein